MNNNTNSQRSFFLYIQLVPSIVAPCIRVHWDVAQVELFLFISFLLFGFFTTIFFPSSFSTFSSSSHFYLCFIWKLHGGFGSIVLHQNHNGSLNSLANSNWSFCHRRLQWHCWFLCGPSRMIPHHEVCMCVVCIWFTINNKIDCDSRQITCVLEKKSELIPNVGGGFNVLPTFWCDTEVSHQ